jgi:hypothetical protein
MDDTDEVARSIAREKANPTIGFPVARRQPALLLTGLATGMVCAVVAAFFLWIFAPLLPALIGISTMLFERTRAFALGALAAACGSATFLLAMAGLFLWA